MSRDGLLDYCLGLLALLGAVGSRRVFGGQGLHVDELFIAFGCKTCA